MSISTTTITTSTTTSAPMSKFDNNSITSHLSASEFDDDIDQSHQFLSASLSLSHSLFQRRGRRKSVSFFDIDTVHYYNSDDCSCGSMSDSSDDSSLTSPTSCSELNCDDVINDVNSLIQQKTNEDLLESSKSPYCRVDLPYKIPCAFLDVLQDTFVADFDLVGEFFADVYMYEVWWRKS